MRGPMHRMQSLADSRWMDQDQAGFAIEKLGTLDVSRRPTCRPIGPEEDPAGFANEAGQPWMCSAKLRVLAVVNAHGISGTESENGLRPDDD